MVYILSNGLEPLAKIGENIVFPLGEKCIAGKVFYISPVQEFSIYAEVNGYSNGQPGKTDISQQGTGVTQLELMNNGDNGILDIGQWRINPSDFIYIEISYPGTSTYKYQTKNEKTYITPFTKENMREIYTYGYSNMPYITILNYLPQTIVAKINIVGIQYKVTLLDRMPDKYIVFPGYSALLVNSPCISTTTKMMR